MRSLPDCSVAGDSPVGTAAILDPLAELLLHLVDQLALRPTRSATTPDNVPGQEEEEQGEAEHSSGSN